MCLIPPESTIEILTRILSDPIKAKASLQAEITHLKEEKDLEKKEAQKLNAELLAATATQQQQAASGSQTPAAPPTKESPAPTTSAVAVQGVSSSQPASTSSKITPAASATATSSVNNDGSTNCNPTVTSPLEAMNAENAEQLMYISAGLSLIILPEHDATGIDMSLYKDRSPTQPSGQRVRSISAAAAAAGEVMLERARKGAVMRDERNRRRQLASQMGDAALSDQADVHNYSRLSILTASNKKAPPAPSSVGGEKCNANSVNDEKVTLPTKSAAAGSSSGKVSTNTTTKQHSTATSSKPSASNGAARSSSTTPTSQPPVTGSSKKSLTKVASPSSAANVNSISSTKAIKARVQATMSVQTLLSLNPSAEELRSDGKVSAATLALMERGVGTHAQNTKVHQQQRNRHPHPESLGGRRRAMQSSNVSHNSSGNKQLATGNTLLHPAYAPLSLPPLPTTKERRSRKRLAKAVTDPDKIGTERAKAAVSQVLHQFVARPASTDVEYVRPAKRRVTEISFLHGLQTGEHSILPSNSEGYATTIGSGEADTAGNTTVNVLANSSTKSGPVDPILAFHVLQAVGLIQPAPTADDNGVPANDDKPFPANLETKMFGIAEKRAMGDEGGVSRRSIGRLKKLHAKFVSNSHRTLSDTFFARRSIRANDLMKSVASTIPQQNLAQPRSMELDSQGHVESEEASTPRAPVMPIRGGGEIVNDNSETGSKSGGNREGRSPQINKEAKGGTVRLPPEVGDSSTARSAKSNQSSPSMPAAGSHQPIWSDSSRQNLVLLNSGMAPGHAATLIQHTNGARMNGQLPNSELYHPNAIQIANQLRLSRVPQQGTHGGAELADYISGLRPQTSAGYDWSSIGAASAASVASAQSLAALGLNPHRAAIANFPLQDRAHALLRDQQTAAAAHAAAAHRQHQQALAYLSGGHGYPATAPSHFAHMSGSMLNSSAAFLGQSNLASVPLHSQQQVRPAPSKLRGQSDQITNKTEAKDSIKGDQMPVVQVTKTETADPKAENAIDSVSSDIGVGKEVGKETSVPKKRKSSEDVAITSPGKKPRVAENSLPRPSAVAACSDEEQSIRFNADSLNVVSIDGNAPVSGIVSAGNSEPESPQPAEKIVPSVEPSKESKDQTAAVEFDSSRELDGLKFFVPPAPIELSSAVATLILEARSHDALALATSNDPAADVSPLIGYVLAVGAAVPIPRALVASVLKEKINGLSVKGNGLNGIPPISRDVVIALINLWLWRHHDDSFQRAFAKSGRIDVDPDCKWLIATAVDRSAQALSQATDSPHSKTGSPLLAALAASKIKNSSGQKGLQEKESDRPNLIKLDILLTSIVSSALMTGLKLDFSMDIILPNFNCLADYLDEARKCALQSKSQERALLAALIARKATMSLPFSHAYVSSVVRAGEAMGHGEFFEVVQNEEVNVSTMIPYDVFTDETGAWEDPCRPANGFTANLTGDDVMRRAHARAMIHKSLKKLQDRHSIKGGTSKFGAYTDPPSAGSGAASDGNKSALGSGATTPRGWLKRRNSFSEPPIQPGTGSAAATSWSVYEPKHFSAPLSWRSDHVENSPYGRHNSSTRPRSLSLSQFNLKQNARGRGRLANKPPSPSPAEDVVDRVESHPEPGATKRSTREVPWVDVAGIFQSVNLPGAPKSSIEAQVTPRAKTIIAPFVRQVRLEDLNVTDQESDDDEDLSDKAVLGRHQVVLDRMKEHLSMLLEVRKKNQDKRKSRTSKT